MNWALVSGVPAEAVRELVAVARRRVFRKSDIVFHRGDLADTLHLVSKGRFGARILTPLGHSALLTIHGPGEAFGELALLSPMAPRSATVSALENGETLSVGRDVFEQLRERHPAVSDVLLGSLSEKLRQVSDRLVAAYYLDAEGRVRWSLAELARAYGRANHAEAVVIPLTQEQIAEYSGVARATANRVLRDEQQRGTLVLERGRIGVVRGGDIARRVGARGPS